MSFKQKLYWILFTVVLLSIITFFLSNKTSIKGDELGTLNIENIHKPLPYKLFALLFLNLFEKIPENIFYLRITSLLFTIITIIIWYKYLLNSLKEVITFNLIVLTSSFIITESIFLRYYSYYFLTSTLFLLFTELFDKRENTKEKLFSTILLTVLSPFIFFILNLIQYISYFLTTFIFDYITIKKERFWVLTLLLLLFSFIVINPIIIWSLLDFFNLSEVITNLETSKIKGIGLSSFIKPFYAIFQFIFGYHLAPTESVFYVILIVTISTFLLKILYVIYIIKKRKFITYLYCFLVPFLILYYVLEPVSMPGFTQLETKHGMFVYPLILLLAIKSNNYLSKKLFYTFMIILITSQSIGLYRTFAFLDTNWSMVNKKINQFLEERQEARLILDGRSMSAFKFYNNGKINDSRINYTWENIDIINNTINQLNPIVLILNDYKSYTSLSIDQNWNGGSGTSNRVKELDSILTKLNKKYFLKDSYVRYPTYVYIFDKKSNDNLNKTAGVWKHHLKDINLPINIEGRKILSSVLISPNDSLFIKPTEKIILNLEGTFSKIIEGEKVGTYKVNDSVFDIEYGTNVWEIFSDFYRMNHNDEKVFYSWVHNPLVSGSIRYPGSYFKHRAYIYNIDINDNSKKEIVIKNMSTNYFIRVWI